jgi:tRNA(fMet)-specific endonuclease VapC
VADPRFLLDTNICIYLLEGISEPARDRFQRCRRGEVVTSAICYAEVMRGIDLDDIDAMAVCRRFFGMVEVLPFEGTSGLTYARLPFRRARYDRLIGAHALTLGLTVVTANEADFADIPGLKAENWTLPLA